MGVDQRVAGPLRRLAARRAPMRVSVTGHRWNRLSAADGARLGTVLARLLSLIGRAAGGCGVLASGMAEGTDLLAAAACPAGWALQPVLALPPDAWRGHLAGLHPPSVAEFERLMAAAHTLAPRVMTGPTPDFAGVGERLVADADLLLAAWDGAPGRPGGTGSVVAAAQQAHLPVLVIPVPVGPPCRLIGDIAPWRHPISPPP